MSENYDQGWHDSFADTAVAKPLVKRKPPKFTLQNAIAILVAGANGAVVYQDVDAATIQKARNVVGANAKSMLKQHRKQLRRNDD